MLTPSTLSKKLWGESKYFKYFLIRAVGDAPILCPSASHELLLYRDNVLFIPRSRPFSNLSSFIRESEAERLLMVLLLMMSNWAIRLAIAEKVFATTNWDLSSTSHQSLSRGLNHCAPKENESNDNFSWNCCNYVLHYLITSKGMRFYF